MAEKKDIIIDGKGAGKLVFPVPQIQRHHVVVSQTITPAGVGISWSQQIFVPFAPDELILRSVNYATGVVDESNNRVYVVQCFTLGEPLAAITNSSSFCPLTVFDLRGKTVNTTWQFQLQTGSGTPANTAEGQLGMMLEFIKY